MTNAVTHQNHEGAFVTTEAVRAEFEKRGSGPALALKTYTEAPNHQRLVSLVTAVLYEKGMPTHDWQHHASVVQRAAQDHMYGDDGLNDFFEGS